MHILKTHGERFPSALLWGWGGEGPPPPRGGHTDEDTWGAWVQRCQRHGGPTSLACPPPRRSARPCCPWVRRGRGRRRLRGHVASRLGAERGRSSRRRAEGARARASPQEPAALRSFPPQAPSAWFCHFFFFFLSAGMSKLFHFRLLKWGKVHAGAAVAQRRRRVRRERHRPSAAGRRAAALGRHRPLAAAPGGGGGGGRRGRAGAAAPNFPPERESGLPGAVCAAAPRSSARPSQGAAGAPLGHRI